MKNRFLASILIITLLATVAVLAPSALFAEAERPESLTISRLSAADDGLTFRLELPAPNVYEESVTVNGLEQLTTTPGAPVLPYYSTLIALPPGAQVEVDVRAAAAQTETLARPLAFNPQRVALPPEEIDIALDEAPNVEKALLWEADPGIFAGARYPVSVYEVTEPVYYRDLRLVRLDLYPVHQTAERTLQWHPHLDVAVSFVGGEPAGRTIAGELPPLMGNTTGNILNHEQAQQWRSLPGDFTPAATTFPVGVETYKIEVDQDGIYEITYTDLENAGMPVESVDPTTFEMMHQGQAVAYQHTGNGDASFDPGEAVRFYGWAFDTSWNDDGWPWDGTRRNDDYVDNNIFWLWAGGTPTTVSPVSGDNSALTVADNFADQAKLEGPVTQMWTSWSDDWDQFDNEGDQFYMELLQHRETTDSWDYEIEILHPDSAATEDFLVRAELSSRTRILDTTGNQITKSWQVSLNSAPTAETREWIGIDSDFNVGPWVNNVDVTSTLASSHLIAGTNMVNLRALTDLGNNFQDLVYLNEFTVDYRRLFRAVGDELLFSHPGDHLFNITDLGVTSGDDIVVWNVTNHGQPQEVASFAGTSGTPGDYSVSFSAAGAAEQSFFVTTNGNMRSPVQISAYTAPDLEPASGGAEWLAISYGDFIAATDILAQHRQEPEYGGLTTHVVDVQDVYNQYAYGYAHPDAIHDYLQHALANWDAPPHYVLLVGDANYNMQGLDVTNYTTWDPNEPNYVVTDLQFVDRFQGMVPMDHGYTQLVGDDPLAEVALGRLPVQSVAETEAAVQKIIEYGENHANPLSAPYFDEIIYVADNPDSGGAFCLENELTAQYVPDVFDVPELGEADTFSYCMQDTSDGDTVRAQMFERINLNGASILNYRGHGTIEGWSHDLLRTSASSLSDWENPGEPVVIFSMDCLDGNFTFPGRESLSETVLSHVDPDLGPEGSAGHWSSTGLGYSSEHRILAREVMQGIFEEGFTALGDAILYSKLQYWMALPSNGLSEIYTFTLAGDPAMHMFRPDLSVTKETETTSGVTGDLVDYTITVENSGMYPAHVKVTDTLPAGMSYITHTATTTTTVASLSPLVFEIHTADPDNNYVNAGLGLNESATITLTVQIDGGGTLVNRVDVDGGGLDLTPSNNSAESSAIRVWQLLLPTLRRQ